MIIKMIIKKIKTVIILILMILNNAPISKFDKYGDINNNNYYYNDNSDNAFIYSQIKLFTY